MRKINLICVGSLKENYLRDATNEYKKRISKFFDLKIIEVNECKVNNRINQTEIERIINTEGDEILKKVSSKNIIALCVESKQYSSEEFSDLICKSCDDFGELNIIIGGSYGLSDNVKNSAKCIGFSKMTFPHQLIRVVLLEQIYRAGTIANNIEYHK